MHQLAEPGAVHGRDMTEIDDQLQTTLLDEAADLVSEDDVAAVVQGDVPFHCHDHDVTNRAFFELHADPPVAARGSSARQGDYIGSPAWIRNLSVEDDHQPAALLLSAVVCAIQYSPLARNPDNVSRTPFVDSPAPCR